MWFIAHLYVPLVPNSSGQLAELIFFFYYSTRIDLYSHQILFINITRLNITQYCMPLNNHKGTIYLVRNNTTGELCALCWFLGKNKWPPHHNYAVRWHLKYHKMCWDFVGHFEWYHLVSESDSWILVLQFVIRCRIVVALVSRWFGQNIKKSLIISHHGQLIIGSSVSKYASVFHVMV